MKNGFKVFDGVVQNQPFLGHRGRTKATGP
jgi:hypothetical protein